MAVFVVKDAQGNVVWTSPDVDPPIVEVVDGAVKVTDFDTGEVVAAYRLKPGEKLVK